MFFFLCRLAGGLLAGLGGKGGDLGPSFSVSNSVGGGGGGNSQAVSVCGEALDGEVSGSNSDAGAKSQVGLLIKPNSPS